VQHQLPLLLLLLRLAAHWPRRYPQHLMLRPHHQPLCLPLRALGLRQASFCPSCGGLHTMPAGREDIR
jgi:hypothetical protein